MLTVLAATSDSTVSWDIGYAIAVIVPILCGACWDLTRLAWTSFMPMVLCAAALTLFGTMLILRKAPQ